MMKDIVNEGSSMSIEARFTSNVNAPVVPLSVRYRIRDLTNNRVVRDWTEISSASTVTIDITADDNDVYNDRPSLQYYFEERVVTVQANFDTDTQYADEYRYAIKNLRGFES